MTVAELITRLRRLPPDAIAVDEDEMEVITVTASRDGVLVILWAEQK